MSVSKHTFLPSPLSTPPSQSIPFYRPRSPSRLRQNIPSYRPPSPSCFHLSFRSLSLSLVIKQLHIDTVDSLLSDKLTYSCFFSEHPDKVKFEYLTRPTSASDPLARPFQQGDVFEYSTPVNNRRVRVRIVYDAENKRVRRRPRDEAMAFEIRLNNGPWVPLSDPATGTRLFAAGPSQIEKQIYKSLGLDAAPPAAKAWERFELLENGITNKGTLKAVRDDWHVKANEKGIVKPTQHRPRGARAAGPANLRPLLPRPPQLQQQ